MVKIPTENQQHSNIIPTEYQQSTKRVPAAAAPELARPEARQAGRGAAGRAGWGAAAAGTLLVLCWYFVCIQLLLFWYLGGAGWWWGDGRWGSVRKNPNRIFFSDSMCKKHGDRVINSDFTLHLNCAIDNPRFFTHGVQQS